MRTTEQHIIDELAKIVAAIGSMFAPFCEVTLNDLRDPRHPIVAIANSISGRWVGDADPTLAQAWPSNTVASQQSMPMVSRARRPFEALTVGIKNEQGQYIAVLSLNCDAGLFARVRPENRAPAIEASHDLPREGLPPLSADMITTQIKEYCESIGKNIDQLDSAERIYVVKTIAGYGGRLPKHFVSILSNSFNISRSTVYNYLKSV